MQTIHRYLKMIAFKLPVPAAVLVNSFLEERALVQNIYIAERNTEVQRE